MPWLDSQGQILIVDTGTLTQYEFTFSCELCGNGTFTNQSNTARICESCPPATTTNSNHTGCIPCSAGYYNNGTQGICSSCPLGAISQEGALACTPCPPGTGSINHSTICITCPTGYYSNITTNGICKQCQNGHISADNFTACVPCPVNHEADTNQEHCIPCNPGFYTNQQGETCKNNPSIPLYVALAITLGVLIGAVSLLACIICIILCKIKAQRRQQNQVDLLDLHLLDGITQTTPDEQDSSSPAPKLNCRLLHIPFEHIKNTKKIGSGGSGTVVLKGTWSYKEVAIKVFRCEDSHLQDFEKELGILS